jgi:hypothetical protein
LGVALILHEKYPHHILVNDAEWHGEDEFDYSVNYASFIEDVCTAFDIAETLRPWAKDARIIGDGDGFSIGIDFSCGFIAVFIIHHWYKHPLNNEHVAWYLCNQVAKRGFNRLIKLGIWDIRKATSHWTSKPLQSYEYRTTIEQIDSMPSCRFDVF